MIGSNMILVGLLVLASVPGQAVRVETQISKTRVDAGANKADCAATLQAVLREMRFKQLLEAASNWRVGGLFRGREYERQWKVTASKEMVLSGSNLAWADIFPKSTAMMKAYVFERTRLTLMSRLQDSGMHIVVNSTVRGICDTSVLLLRFLTHQPPLLAAVKEMLPEDSACAGKSLAELAVDAGDGISAECFDNCLDTLKDSVREFECKPDALTEDFYTQVMDANEQCASMPFDSLENLARYSMRQKCSTFTSPHTLYSISDKAPGQISNVPDDKTSVCYLPPDKNTTKSNSYIKQHGTCPEGSKCKCPITSLKGRQTAMQIRLNNGMDIFARSGTASLPSLTKQYGTTLLVSTLVVQMGINGLAASAALVASLEAPMFLVGGTVQTSIKTLANYAAFHCADTLGCWPQAPEQVSVPSTPDACRLPIKAKEGGSPVWFLPPPMLRMKHSKGQCVLDVCDTDDYIRQTIGLGRSENDRRYEGQPNIFNCQPLSFEDMTNKQRFLFLQRLNDTGVSEEYDISGLLRQYQSWQP